MNNEVMVAGDAYDFDTTVPGYSAASGWTLFIRFAGVAANGTPFSLTSTPNGDAHRIQVTAAASASWVPGEYGWNSWVENGAGERHSVSSGTVTIKPNPQTIAAGTDQRTHARKMLDAIEAVLEGRATSDMSSYMVAGRQVILLSPDALVRWRGYYQALVRSENGGKSGLRVKFIN